MTKKINIPTATTGDGYSGQWCDGKIGWFVSPHVSGSIDKKYPVTNCNDYSKKYLAGERSFLCKITIVPLVDKKGRPITKLTKL